MSGRSPRRAAAEARIQILLNAIGRTQLARVTNSGLTLDDLSYLIENDDYEDDDQDYPIHQNWFPPVTEPQDAGVQLLNSGEFGRVQDTTGKSLRKINLGRLLTDRTCQPYPRLYKEDYAHNLVPNCNGTTVALYDSNIYTAQFSNDSSFYYTCSQDFRLHLYDTTAPLEPSSAPTTPEPGLETVMPVKYSIKAHMGRWTITDASLSPDNERMVYSSLTSTAHVTSALESTPAQIPIPFSDPLPPGRRAWGRSSEDFRIYSCRFSADGNEIIAGGSSPSREGRIYVYDLLANRRTVKIDAHGDDVNSCCWADSASGNVLVSASDDCSLKVWDRRSLGVSRKPSGVLIGHTEGITYVSAKGDGRYVISNGKDQAIRLWDLRRMRTNAEHEDTRGTYHGLHKFDYRYPPYPKPEYAAHPFDCSVMTYRGHSVLRTLIRCHFSPAETTGGKYLYSGSADGQIHIWSLDGRIVQVLNATQALPISSDASAPEEPATSAKRRPDHICVRDLSWHSQEPYLMSAAWSDRRNGSLVVRHEWKGLAKMSGSLEDWTEKSNQERKERQGSTSAMPGAFQREDF